LFKLNIIINNKALKRFIYRN